MGCGVVADYGHIPAILQTPGLELKALFDPNEERLKQVSARHGNPLAFTKQDEFLDCGLDAVVVASPVPFHKANVLGAAKRGLHVLCEKPIGMDDAEVEEMIGVMKKTGKLFLCGFVYRYSPVAVQLKRWVEEGIVGDIKSLRLIYIWDLHGEYEPVAEGKWIRSPRYIGRMDEGGPMVDCGVHQIDLARWWTGQEVVGTTASAAWVGDYEAPDHVYLHLDHAKGAHTMVEMSYSYGHTAREPYPHFSYHLIGSGGVLRYDRDGYILEARHGEGTIRIPGASEKNFPGMYAALSEALRTGDPKDFPTAEDGLIATKLARRATDELIAKHNAQKKKLKLA